MTEPDRNLSWWCSLDRTTLQDEAAKRARAKSNADQTVYWRGGTRFMESSMPVDYLAPRGQHRLAKERL